MSQQLCAGCFDDVGYFERLYARTQERLAAVLRDAVELAQLLKMPMKASWKVFTQVVMQAWFQRSASSDTAARCTVENGTSPAMG